MLSERQVAENIIKVYARPEEFPICTASQLRSIYRRLGVDPKSSHRVVFDTESLSHHHQALMIRLFGLMKIKSEHLVLEAGCGNGGPSRLLAKLVGCRIKAFDINPEQIKRAKACNVLEGVDSLISASVQDVHHADFPAASFDRVFHNETCLHWRDKELAFSRLHRFLKKGGIMGFHDLARGEEGGLESAGDYFARIYPPGALYCKTAAETRKLLRAAGFRLLRFEDTTDEVDAGLRARVRVLEESTTVSRWLPGEIFHKILRYYRMMVKANRRYVRYIRCVCAK